MRRAGGGTVVKISPPTVFKIASSAVVKIASPKVVKIAPPCTAWAHSGEPVTYSCEN